ncbi:MAG: TatD family hydrolase [Flavobacteriaceae bacterium]|jgi:TatD DNase family protein|nr:TatD family hydrolase [Flavobacteriaceae bacterium]
MFYFDFHHHKKYPCGIYNWNLNESVPEIPFSAGIHPKDIDENFNENLEKIKMISQRENCFAIGECGLDSLVSADKKIQEDVFLRQIKIAEELRKPIIIHCIRSFYEIISFRKHTRQAMIIHGFNKKQSVAEDLLKNNFYLSFGKAVLYHLSLQNIVKMMPLDKMFLETDNEDFNIEELYKKVSEIKEISVENLHERILENVDRLVDTRRKNKDFLEL